MGWTKKNELNIVEFVEGKPEELVFSKLDTIIAKDGKEYDIMETVNAMGVKEHYFLSGHLKYLISQNDLKENDKIRVTYKGLSKDKVKTAHGEKQIHQYTLEVWED